MTESVAEFIQRHDAGRVPELLALRYRRMEADALAFFRGSAPLYYARFRGEPVLGASPVAWLCGDAHVENFGSFRGDNRLVYFDVNDFDEAMRGPVLWDVGRLAVSVLLAAARFGLPPAGCQALARGLSAPSASLPRPSSTAWRRSTSARWSAPSCTRTTRRSCATRRSACTGARTSPGT